MVDEVLSKRDANRQRRYEAFVEAAQTLFAEKGFENTSIEEVLERTRMSRRTLYQYFTSKEDLFYAVALEGARRLAESAKDGFAQGATAREKLELINRAHLEFYRSDPALFRIVNKALPNQDNNESSPHWQQLRAIDAERMQQLPILMEAARTDGSLSSERDPAMAVLFGFFTAYSLLHTFAFTDPRLWKAIDLDDGAFLDFSMDLLSDALAAGRPR